MPDRMTFQFLDVGMGDGTLVQIRRAGDAYDHLVLVDFGEKRTQYKIPYEDAMKYLVDTIGRNSTARGRTRPFVDYLFITHPDGDHYNKIAELVDQDYPGYPATRQLEFGDLWFSGNSSEYGDLIDDTLDGLVDEDILPMQQNYHSEIDDGDVSPTIEIGDVRIYVLSSNWPTRSSATNPKSIVLQFDLQGEVVTLTGDATKATEDHIRDNFTDGFLKSRGLKLGHHGSKGSSSEDWIDAVDPDAIFGSADFAWSHPYCEVICRFLDKGMLPDHFPREIYYCCGDGGTYYDNSTRKVIGMNLWYTVFDSPDYLIEDDGVTRVIGFLHNVFGVQWEMELTPGAAPSYAHTEAVWRERGAAPDGWDCDAMLQELAQRVGGCDVSAPGVRRQLALAGT